MNFLTSVLDSLRGLFGQRAVEQAVGEWPDTVDDSHVDRGVRLQTMVDGLYMGATYKPAHPGRLGKGITPRAIIVHTTDMAPGTHDALIRNWTQKKGAGNCAHFLVSKDGNVTQFASIYVNANHAGGPNCGGFRAPNGASYHPNSVGIGIELDNAGRLKQTAAGTWVHPESGYEFPKENVFVDDKGRGWERITASQKIELSLLLGVLERQLAAFPAGTVVVPNASYASQSAQYAAPASLQIVGHASLNPINKSDPGPEVMAEIKKFWATKKAETPTGDPGR